MYVILNDSVTPWIYYAGNGFAPLPNVTVDPMEAQTFPTLRAAIDVLGQHPNKAQLYAQGWRIVPADK